MVLYSHVPYHNDSIIKTDAVINDARMTSLTTYIPLHFIARVRKGCQSLHERGCWRPNINFIFWPHCYDRHVMSFLISWCSTRAVGSTQSGVSEGLLGRVWLSLVSNSLGVYWQLLWDPNSTELNNNSTPTRSPTGSLNRMFNRHQAEITVMQFRGYSLPVHHCSGTMGPSPCPIS